MGRDPERSAAAAAEIRAEAAPGARVDFVRADFDRMAEVLRAAEEIHGLTARVDVLVNNAGGLRKGRIVTPEGNEATFAANHLAHFLLTRELLPLLRDAAADAPPGSVRVLAVSSDGHEVCPGFDWDDLQMLERADFSTTGAYTQAKLANILFTRELDRRVAADGIVAHAMHPGSVDSNFKSHAEEAIQAYIGTLELHSPEVAAETLVWLATAPENGVDGGRYFQGLAELSPSPLALDDELARRLWQESEKLLAGY